ncbi:XRE family transcriptional regulator [Massilia phosphatilytica]|jgi:transcriptional regulator with XRE-family HTH domain|uniref:helix-turn-helix domain-containing protein n=1 Tax=Massilia TaxID=149698 RepID=UPI000CF8417E|nr:helix-turn-helix transcriptional regulator [Massilia sp. YIM B02763]MDN4055695.1 helix-turn-helix transcriptional regulator [Massilia sp. YIM B02763]PQO94692.1 XRE family transcriptional regulator [Massilia phosphatilytica]
MNLGKAIQTSRQRRKLSQEALAKLAGCSVSYLSMLENSKRDPTISTVEKIAAALKIPVEILFFLAAEKGELAGINKELAGQLALTALELLDEKAPE